MPRSSLRVVQITALNVVPREQVLARIARSGPHFAVQLRDPELEARALFEWGRELRAATRAAGSMLIVNDRIDLAIALEADGIHLGHHSIAVRDARRLVDTLFVSRSAHDRDEALRAADEGADAVLLSPIFEAPGKGRPLGLETLRDVRARLPDDVALVALGGITRETASDCLRAGADGVASIRADLGGRP